MILEYGKNGNMFYTEAEEIEVVKINVQEIISDFYKQEKNLNTDGEKLDQICRLKKTVDNYIRTQSHCGDDIIYHISTPFTEMSGIVVINLLTRGTSERTYIFEWSGTSDMDVFLLNNNGKTIQRIA